MYKLAHIGVVVKNADQSSLFYQKVLGCEPMDSYQDERVKLIFLNSAGQTIELVQHMQGDPSPERPAGRVDHIAFKVDDVFAEMDKMRSAGIQPLTDKPKKLNNGIQNFYILGPDGERLEFMQEATR
ncbi:MAG: VOC family protein [Negativicutes bacterium]|nr:VOC family protein [Negativicutes bacterium]